jgi:hypothetical protein
MWVFGGDDFAMTCLAVLRERGARRAQRAKANPSRWLPPRPTRQIRAEPRDCSTSGVSVSRRCNPAFCSHSRLMTLRSSTRRADPSRVIDLPGPSAASLERCPAPHFRGAWVGFGDFCGISVSALQHPACSWGRNRTWDSQPRPARTNVLTFLPQGPGGPDQPSGAMIRSCCEE